MANQDEAPRTYATRLLTQIETIDTTKQNTEFVRKLAKLHTGGPIDLETWTNGFITDFNAEPSINEKDKIPTTNTSPGLMGMDNQEKTQFLQQYHNTRNQADHPFQDATIVNSIGDGTCLIHSCFNALSETYRGLDEKYQQLIGLFFRKHVYSESIHDEDQKKRAKQLFEDKVQGISLEDTFLDDTDVRSLAQLFGKNILVFQERKNANNQQENQCRYFRVNDGPTISLYLQGENHYDTIRFQDNTFEQPDAWSKDHFPDAYDVEVSSERLDLVDIFLREASQFLSREVKHSKSPSDLFLDAVSNYLAPPKIPKVVDVNHHDNTSELTDDDEEEEGIELYVQDIYQRLNDYLHHIYPIMKSIKEKKQFRSTGSGTDPVETSKFVPTTIENNTKCNGKFTVQVDTVTTDNKGNQLENDTVCL